MAQHPQKSKKKPKASKLAEKLKGKKGVKNPFALAKSIPKKKARKR